MGEVDSTTNVGNSILLDYSNWLATTAIPKYFDEDLKSNITLKLNSNTLNDYINKVILMLKYKFPNHCI